MTYSQIQQLFISQNEEFINHHLNTAPRDIPAVNQEFSFFVDNLQRDGEITMDQAANVLNPVVPRDVVGWDPEFMED